MNITCLEIYTIIRHVIATLLQVLLIFPLIPAQQFCGFQYPAFKTHEINTKNTETHYMSNTKSNPDTLIAGFLLPWKVTNNSTGKEQPNNHKQPCAWILPVLQCLQNLTGFINLSGKFSQKNQKIDFSTFRFFRIVRFFRLFDFSNFSDFSFFSTFRAEISCEVNFSTFRLFDFSTFRGQKTWFSRCDRYQPEEHTGVPTPTPPPQTHHNIVEKNDGEPGGLRVFIYIYIIR